MARLRGLYLISLAHITSEITETILVSHLSAVVAVYHLLEPTKTLGHKLAIHRTWYPKQFHSIRPFSLQTTIRRHDLVGTPLRIKLSSRGVPAMMVRLTQ